MKIFVFSSALSAGSGGAHGRGASTDFAFASRIVVPGTHRPDWSAALTPLWVPSARAAEARGSGVEAVAATVTARGWLCGGCVTSGGPFTRDLCL